MGKYDFGRNNSPFKIIAEDRWGVYIKNEMTIRAMQMDCDGYIDTLEGRLAFKKDHYVCVGTDGEIYPNEKGYFEDKYESTDFKMSDVDSKIITVTIVSDKTRVYGAEYITQNWNVYKTSDLEIRAIKINEPFTVESMWGLQNGKAGDYLMCYKDDYFYVCDGEIFSKTYKKIK